MNDTSIAASMPPVLLVATAVTGVVDAVSFLALGHVFTANITGNVVFLGFAFAGAPGLSIPYSSLSLLAFVVGALMGGRIAAQADSKSRRWITRAFLLDTFFLVAATAGSIGLKDRSDGHKLWSRGVPRWFRGSLSVADPFVCRCLTSSILLRFHTRSSNRTCAINASGSRRKVHEFAHGKLRGRSVRRTKPSTSCRSASGNRAVALPGTLCLARSH
jgi:hypothetical protein